MSLYQSVMAVRASVFQAAFQPLPHRAATLTLLALLLGFGLCGCADMGDSVAVAFADPAKYDLYDCKQLEPERKSLATRLAEQEGLMAKAQTGTAGPLVGELAYRNEIIAIRGQAHFADEAWRRNKCHDTPPAAAVAAPLASPPPSVHAKAKPKHSSAPSASAKPAPPSTSGSAVY
jgi:hypothetical protein